MSIAPQILDTLESHRARSPELRVHSRAAERAAPRDSLPARAIVTSFRFRPSADDIHGGQDGFVHGLVKALTRAGVAVDVLTFRGRDDPREARVDGARVHFLETEFSRSLTAHEAHQGGTWRLLEVMAAYASAVERALPPLRARDGGQPLVILSQDVGEARWVRSARRAGDRIVTFAHVLFSEFALHDLTLGEFRRMNDAAHFPLHVRALARVLLDERGATRTLETVSRLLLKTELIGFIPGAARAALEGERAAFVEAQRVLLPSAAMRDKVLARYGRRDAEEALQVAPWGIELDPVAPDRVRALAQELGIGPEDRVLVTMSRLSPDKRIDALLSALARIDSGDPALARRVVAVICGRPTFLDDREYEQRLQVQARSLKHVRVRFAGYQRGELRTAHLDLAAGGRGRFVQVGRYEAFGLGIAEALSRGAAAITSDTDGARAILDPADCVAADDAACIVGEPADEPFDAALARAIVRELGRSAPEASPAAKRVARRFTWEGTIEAVVRAVSEITPPRADDRVRWGSPRASAVWALRRARLAR
ncbi:MAG: glycosyltransferase family 4 protein [Deltaproteobacteria bacterium]|nr:glycosyltransferase family 4 protein [Deltaproteobacteria bacterium]